jgi:hypothetical protein
LGGQTQFEHIFRCNRGVEKIRLQSRSLIKNTNNSLKHHQRTEIGSILLLFKVCCGCFGPAGGTDDYCNPDCTAKNGGTVKKDTYTWFWVRTSLPKRVWHRCMEYKVKNENGDMVSYKLLDGNTTPEKVTV